VAEGAIDHSAYTWDPVTAAWVHERGPEIPPPPPPPDVHALQTYFFEPESKQWIRTVLADRGRELAKQWRGAHRIPTEGAVPAVKGKLEKKSSPMPVIAAVVVLLLIVGGAAVFASQSGLLAGTVAPAATTPAASAASVAPSAAAASPSGSPSPSATAATGGGGGGGAPPPRTAPPATLSLPPGLSTRMADGTAVVYTGPTLVVKPQALAATLTVTRANGQPATGAITVVLSTVSANGTLDGNGRVAVTLATTSLNPGQYPLSVVLQGQLATVTQITVR
jgi:hypothetical protein